jgi:phosphatidylglycerophosphate synthase
MADLTEKHLENMKNHKYSTTGYTTQDNKMNPFWIKCASFLPYAFTPNMVTVTGLLCQFLSIIIISFYDLTFSVYLSPYVYIFCAFMLFMAQTLDAIDGKHARNTKRSSSLGQLMDHGCDSMDNFLFCIVLSQAFLFGNSIHTLMVQLLIQIPFYTYTLEENITGTLRTQINNVGVTEYQFFCMGLLLLSALFGEKLIVLEIFGIKLIIIILYCVVVSSIANTLYLIWIDVKQLNADIKRFTPLFTMIAFAVAEFFSYQLNLYKNKPLLVVLLNGLYYSLFTCKLIISNMAKREIQIFDIDIIAYITGVLTCVFIGSKLIEFFILIVLFIWLSYRYYNQIIYAIFKMLDYLKIPF